MQYMQVWHPFLHYLLLIVGIDMKIYGLQFLHLKTYHFTWEKLAKIH